MPRRSSRIGGRPPGPAARAIPVGAGDAELPCARRPHLFFSDRCQEIRTAKTLCAGCGIRRSCLAGALERREPAGVWGGQLFRYGVIAVLPVTTA